MKAADRLATKGAVNTATRVPYGIKMITLAIPVPIATANRTIIGTSLLKSMTT